MLKMKKKVMSASFVNSCVFYVYCVKVLVSIVVVQIRITQPLISLNLSWQIPLLTRRLRIGMFYIHDL